MIDTHAHLTDERLTSQIEDVIARAKEAGVERIIVPGTSLEDSKKVVELADKYDEVYGLVGIHPEEITNHKSQITNFREELERLAGSSGKIVGIGEIGLDFHYDKQKTSLEVQREIFEGQLDLGVKLNLPTVIHMRDAEEEMVEILGQRDNLPRGQFHCFAGSDDFLKLVLEKGFYVSFCGNITYKSAEKLREQAKLVPADRLLLETDSPYLAPEPVRQAQGKVRRGSLNEPANVKIIAEYIAKLLDVPPDTLINQTTANAKWLFFGG